MSESWQDFDNRRLAKLREQVADGKISWSQYYNASNQIVLVKVIEANRVAALSRGIDA